MFTAAASELLMMVGVQELHLQQQMLLFGPSVLESLLYGPWHLGLWGSSLWRPAP